MVKKMNTFDIWRIVLYAIVFGSLIPSACYSLFAFSTLGYHTYAKFLMLFGAVVVEGVKVIFPKLSISQKDWSKKLRSVLMLIGVLAMMVSLVFSFAFSVNENNAVKNEFINNSDEAKTANKAVTVREKLINRLETEIDELKADKKTELSVLDKVKFRTKRETITAKFNTAINKKSEKLTEEQSKATTPEAIVVKTQKNVDVALGAIMSAEQEKTFFGFLVVFIEFAGLTSTIILSIPRKAVKKHLFIYEDDQVDADARVNLGADTVAKNNVIDIGDGKSKSINNSTDNLISDLVDTDAVAKGNDFILGTSELINTKIDADLKTKNRIGFNQDRKLDFTDIELQLFTDEMYKTEKENNQVDGFVKISKKINKDICKFPESSGRKIHGFLEKSGILFVDRKVRRSYVLKQKNKIDLMHLYSKS